MHEFTRFSNHALASAFLYNPRPQLQCNDSWAEHLEVRLLKGAHILKKDIEMTKTYRT